MSQEKVMESMASSLDGFPVMTSKQCKKILRIARQMAMSLYNKKRDSMDEAEKSACDGLMHLSSDLDFFVRLEEIRRKR